MKKTEKQYTFADSILQNYNEVLVAAIEFHYQYVPKKEITELSDNEIQEDSNNISDNILHPDYEEIEYTAGLDNLYRTREQLIEDITEKIKEIYN